MYKTEVESKFAPNQEVWFIYNNGVYHKKIKSVRFSVFEKHFFIEYIFDRILGVGDDLVIKEYKLFESKEELIKSL